MNQEHTSPADYSDPRLGNKKKRVKASKGNSNGDSSDSDNSRKPKKRNRMALSCGECKRRKIKCDREMPNCGQCIKRGRPELCSWDIFANDAAVPASIARTADVEALSARITHIETYLKTLPPNLTSFVPQVHALAMHTQTTTIKTEHEEAFSDTEDAAVNLENGVFGRPAAFGESHASQKPKKDEPIEYGSVVYQRERQPARNVEMTKAFTSIVAPERSLGPGGLGTISRVHLGIDFGCSSTELDSARDAAIDRILRAIPDQEVVDHLVQLYFTQVSWLFHHIHAPTFMVEVEAFHGMLKDGRGRSVDLLWASLLLMVLCVALDSTHSSRSPLSLSNNSDPIQETPLSCYSPDELRELPEVWFQASQAALLLGEWEAMPRVRSIQTIILFTQYLQLCSSNRGQPSQLATWLAGAIRIATVLGLHLLGSNPEVMPVDDPAWPPGKNSLKRESAKRIWGVLVYQDWIGASSKNRNYFISPIHCDTDDPGNINDADLSAHSWKVEPLPANILTDSSSDRIRIAIARQVRKVFDAVVLAKDFTYDTVLKLDQGYQDILKSFPDRWTLEVSADESDQPMLRYQRHFALEGLHNRIFRLHRPFSTRGYSQEKYRFSTTACIKSARVVIVSTHNIAHATRDIWWIYSHVMGAALVLFNDLFQAIDHDTPTAELEAKRDTLRLARQIFSTSDQITLPSLQNVVSQGSKILVGLFEAEERRVATRAAAAILARSGSAMNDPDDISVIPEAPTFAQVLYDISRSLAGGPAVVPHCGTPPATRNLPNRTLNPRGGERLNEPPEQELSLPVTTNWNANMQGSEMEGDVLLPSMGFQYNSALPDSRSWADDSFPLRLPDFGLGAFGNEYGQAGTDYLSGSLGLEDPDRGWWNGDVSPGLW